MKIRNSFVSNSSSSSYMILGWKQEPDHDKMLKFFEKYISECLEEDEDPNDRDLLKEIYLQKLDEGELYIGTNNLTNMNDIYGIYLPNGSPVPSEKLIEELLRFAKKVDFKNLPLLYHTTFYC